MKKSFALIMFALAIVSPALGASLSDVRNGIELFMIKTRGWPAVHCRAGEYQSRNFVYCHPTGNDSFGGLFMVENNPTPAVWPINGKAKQYLAKGRPTLVNTTPIEVRQWTGDPIDIPAAIKAVR